MNKVELLGRICQDLVLRYTPTTNKPVVSFSLAVDRKKQKDKERETDFINIVAFNYIAEFIEKYFSKGKKIIIVGRIQTRSYQDNNGQKRYITEVVAEEVFFGDSNKKEEETNIDDIEFAPNFSINEDDSDLPF